MQRYELEAWLGDNHGLTEDQVTDLLGHANEIEARYPDPDDQNERDAALEVAYRFTGGDEGVANDVMQELAIARGAAQAAENRALAGLRQAAIMQIPTTETESSFARAANVDRMTVRKWLGK
ncbi:hypothetical protein [Streptomyces scopuliridis]|uniref:hypothetical protein n=1 Tax=Streptomyces scopuliridis TaxID=452529 RepID=UPI0035DB4D6D